PRAQVSTCAPSCHDSGCMADGVASAGTRSLIEKRREMSTTPPTLMIIVCGLHGRHVKIRETDARDRQRCARPRGAPSGRPRRRARRAKRAHKAAVQKQHYETAERSRRANSPHEAAVAPAAERGSRI